jgi:multicomponent Na+:H+ antiporter subunit D
MPFFVVGFLALFISNSSLRTALLLAVPVTGFLFLLQTESGVSITMNFLDYKLTPFRTDKLSFLFGYLFCIASFIAVLFSLHVKQRSQHSAGIIYAGSAVGAVFAGDLITLFVFLELMAVSSAFLIWGSGTRAALRSGLRYMIIQVISGVLLLAGAIMLWYETGSLSFNHIGLSGLASWLIFLSLGIKAAFPFLHNWVTDSYPQSTVSGAVFLCAFTTKVSVYALARGYAGTEILIYIGAVMVAFPIFYAVIENNMRRVLSYSMINQVGFMVCGVGIGTELAINGAVGTAFNHVIYKGLLFMSMGAVLHMTGRIKASDIGGLYKTMPITTIACIIGAASISAVPLFSGFVSKGMILSAALAENMDWIWVCLLFASAGVFHHAGIKIPYFAFFGKDSGIRTSDPPKHMLLAMGLASAICVGIGVYPSVLYEILPFDVDYVPYDLAHVLTQLQLLAFAGLAFVVLNLAKLEPHDVPSVNIDVEWLYRKALPGSVRYGIMVLKPHYDGVLGFFHNVIEKGIIGNLTRHHGPEGILTRAWPVGSMVLWVAVLLGFYLILYYFIGT